MPDRVGQEIGQYRLTKLLGKGGFAEVYLGVHRHLGTEAAIKILSTQLAADDQREQFRKEALTIARLNHPNIVRLLDFGIEDDTPYLVMAYAPNGSLRRLFPRGQAHAPTAFLPYIKQVADALQYAHNHQIIHRDIKPENLLLGPENDVLLTDFGIATAVQLTSQQKTEAVVGTAAYVAPEQLQGKPRPASDQYSLGIIIYEWLTGTWPFHGSLVEIVSQQVLVPPPSLRQKVPNVSPGIEQVVLRALAKDPKARFESVQAFAKAFERACRSGAWLAALHGPTAGASGATPVADQGSQAAPDHQAVIAQIGTLPPAVALGHSESTDPEQADSAVQELDPAILAARPGVIAPIFQPTSQEKRGISRRTLLVGLGGAAVVGGGLAALLLRFPRPAPGPVFRASPTAAISPTATTGSPTATPPAPTPTLAPVGTTFFTYRGHNEQIRAVAWSPDGTLLASACGNFPTSRENTVQVWDALTYTHLFTYTGHSQEVRALAWSPESSRIASASFDGTVQVWDARTGDHVLNYPGHHSEVRAVGWSPNGRYIASGGSDNTVQVWDARTGATLYTYRGHQNILYSLAWSPNSQRIASGAQDQTAQVWDALDGGNAFTYRGHRDLSVLSLAWSPDNARLASSGTDGTVQVWDARDGRNASVYYRYTDWIWAVAWSPDGKRLAAGGRDQVVQVWDATTGMLVYTYRGALDIVTCVAWAPQGYRVASGGVDTTVQVWQAG